MVLKIKCNSKTTAERILFEVAMLCIFSYGLLENVSIPIPMFSSVKMPLLYVAGMCVMLHISPLFRVIKKKKYFYVMAVLALFCLSLLMSMTYSTVSIRGATHRRNTIRLVMYLAELFLFMIWTVENDRSKHVMNFLFCYVLILTILTDFFFFSRLVVFMSGKDEYYLVGTKFSVAYFHINLLTLWYIRDREKFYSDRKAKRIIMLGIPYTMFVAICTDCMTGFLGCLILLVLFFLLKNTKHVTLATLKSPTALLMALAASVIFPFVAEHILAMPIVEKIIMDILGRNTELTGRMNIYTYFVNRMEGHWMWGYGFGNANIMAKQLFGYANVQNGLLQWVFQVGIIGSALLIFLMYTIFFSLKGRCAVDQAIPLIFLIYLYIILGMVETTFSMSFIIWLALIFMLAADTCKQDI